MYTPVLSRGPPVHIRVSGPPATGRGHVVGSTFARGTSPSPTIGHATMLRALHGTTPPNFTRAARDGRPGRTGCSARKPRPVMIIAWARPACLGVLHGQEGQAIARQLGPMGGGAESIAVAGPAAGPLQDLPDGRWSAAQQPQARLVDKARLEGPAATSLRPLAARPRARRHELLAGGRARAGSLGARSPSTAGRAQLYSLDSAKLSSFK